MSKIEERIKDNKYKVHELREEIEVNYEHMIEIRKLLRKKYPEEFMPVTSPHSLVHFQS
jgi:hypothetical protein